MGFNYEQYELAIAKKTSDFSNCDGWSNANGYNKADLNSKIKDAKDTIIDRTGKRNLAQSAYDEANGRKCSGCGGKKEPSCHDRCWAKESDKNDRANDIRIYTAEINTANSNIGAWEHELDVIAEEEANTPTPSPTPVPTAPSPTPTSGTTTTGGNTNTTTGGNTNTTNTTTTTTTGGLVKPNVGVGATPDTTKSKTKNYLIIGGAVLILGIVGFFVFRKK